MLLGNVVRNEQKYQQRDRLAVRRFKGDAFVQPDKGRAWRLQTFYAAMRHGDTVTKAGRAQPFAGEQVFRDRGAGDATVIFEYQAGLFKRTLFARHIEIEHDIGRRQDLAEMVHGALRKNGVWN